MGEGGEGPGGSDCLCVELCPGELQDPVREVFPFPRHHLLWPECLAPGPLQCRALPKGGAQGARAEGACRPGGEQWGRGQRRGGERRGPRVRVRCSRVWAAETAHGCSGKLCQPEPGTAKTPKALVSLSPTPSP